MKFQFEKEELGAALVESCLLVTIIALMLLPSIFRLGRLITCALADPAAAMYLNGSQGEYYVAYEPAQQGNPPEIKCFYYKTESIDRVSTIHKYVYFRPGEDTYHTTPF